jgi:1-acyl-sn-glycerol-3-phosphate acyltransferase
LAGETGKDIIPALIFNTKKALPVNKKFFLWPHFLEIHFLPPVSVEEITSKDLKEKVFEIMWHYYENHSRHR